MIFAGVSVPRDFGNAFCGRRFGQGFLPGVILAAVPSLAGTIGGSLGAMASLPLSSIDTQLGTGAACLGLGSMAMGGAIPAAPWEGAF